MTSSAGSLRPSRWPGSSTSATSGRLPGGVFVVSIDPGVTTAAVVLLQFVDLPGVRECRVMESWKGRDATAQTYARVISPWQGQYGKLLITGDPSGQNRDLVRAQSGLQTSLPRL